MMKRQPVFRGPDVLREIAFAGAFALTVTIVVPSPATFATEKDWQPITREEVLEIIEALHTSGMAVIVVTHDPQIGKRAERSLTIIDGRLVEDVRRRV
jgi:ABC-type lipoprotein export system ATPase subunit